MAKVESSDRTPSPDREVLADRHLRQAVTAQDVEEALCKAFAVAPEALGTRGRHGNEAREAAIHLCRRLTLASARALGERFGGVSRQAISKTAREVAERREGDTRLDRVLAKIEKQLREK